MASFKYTETYKDSLNIYKILLTTYKISLNTQYLSLATYKNLNHFKELVK